VIRFEASPTVKDAGRKDSNGMMAAVIRIVEMMSCHLMMVSTLSALIVAKLVAKKVVTKDTKIPTEVIIKGK
jgi:hypothetical protein